MSEFNDTRSRCLFLIALDVVMVFTAFLLPIIYSSRDVGMFSLGEVLVIYGTPAWLALRGIIVRLAFKQVWTPTLILFFEIWLPIFIIQICSLNIDVAFLIYVFLVPLCITLFSALFSLLTDIVIRLYKAGKAIANSPTIPSEEEVEL